ncbi:MAG: symmetrical bis(5'-nucleosyl)-tetraphosphatase [Colwellia sp.]
MAIYIVGDLQGCLSELNALLKQVNFNPISDELWLTGDIVARGPSSLETLRFIKSMADCVKMVLGNHDLHLLAVHAGIKKSSPKDYLDDILSAPDRNALMNWLAQQPLLRKIPNENAYMTHAGISPQWSVELAIKQAQWAEKKIQGTQRNYWLEKMYGEQPNSWPLAKTDIEKFRYTINSLTRMRYCFRNKTLDFSCKLSPKSAPKELTPWYKLSGNLENTQWIIGHWAWLMGETHHNNLFALDTGCVYGNHLTMLHWHDKKIFIEPAHNIRK